MNIMENKRVTAIAALMGIAFIGICFKGYESYAELKASQEDIARKIDLLSSYTSSDIPPTTKNKQEVEKAAVEVKGLAGELSKDIEKYITFCKNGQPNAESTKPHGYMINASPVTFQNRLRDLSADIAAMAQREKCDLNNSSADFGMTSLKTQAPKEVDAPYLNFLLSAVDRVERHIISAGAPSIERIYCAPLPEEEISARKKPDFFPLSFEVAFTARRSEIIKAGDAGTYSVLPKVINSIIHDGDFFFIITGMAVGTQGSLPLVSQADAAAAGEAVAPEAEEAAPEETNASLIIGKDSERVNVHLNIQVLYFNADKL